MISIIIAVAVIIIDQISKLFAFDLLRELGSVELIKGVLNLTYVENKGAAFGILSDNRMVFMLASVLIIALLVFIIYKFHGKNRLFDICLGLILGGGAGNMIDRIRLGYVIDFVDFCAFDFWKWVFNLADSAVVVGCILAIICLIFEQKNGNDLLSDVSEEENGDE